MANKNYSASRFGTFKDCLQKYKLTYIDELVVENREFSVQKKGLVFHKIAEETQVGESYDSIYKRAENEIASSGMTNEELEKYPLLKAIPGFYFWWQTYVENAVNNEGYSLFKEQWENSELNGEPLVGALDVCLINEKEKKFKILDYKSGSSAKLSDGYKNQLLLYVYMLAKKYNIPTNELTDRFKCYLFYPLAGIKTVDVNNKEAIQKLALKNTLEYKFTVDDYNDLVTEFSKIINETKTKDWSALDPLEAANLSFSCSFCGFCGHPKYCKLSYDSGLTFPHSAKVMTKEESKLLHASTK
jgi:hypothetical protein